MGKNKLSQPSKPMKLEENEPKPKNLSPKDAQPPASAGSKKIKKVHLPAAEISSKMNQLQDQLEKLQGSENHKKRKRLFYKMAKLKKALEKPEQYLVDPSKEKAKAQQDLQKRIEKKRQKKASLQVTAGPQRHKKTCLICKKVGHTKQECPESEFLQQDGIDMNATICYNCGRTDHLLKNCTKKRKKTLPFAVCFVCKESGHIARDCPQNQKGMYAQGGGCYICDSVRHKASECPKNPANQIREKKKHGEKEKSNDEAGIKNENQDEEEEETMGQNENVEELEPEIEEEEDD